MEEIPCHRRSFLNRNYKIVLSALPILLPHCPLCLTCYELRGFVHQTFTRCCFHLDIRVLSEAFLRAFNVLFGIVKIQLITTRNAWLLIGVTCFQQRMGLKMCGVYFFLSFEIHDVRGKPRKKGSLMGGLHVWGSLFLSVCLSVCLSLSLSLDTHSRLNLANFL